MQPLSDMLLIYHLKCVMDGVADNLPIALTAFPLDLEHFARMLTWLAGSVLCEAGYIDQNSISVSGLR